MKIRVAELNIEIHNTYPYCEDQCRDYLADFEEADITVSVTPEELAEERSHAKLPFPDGYLESICIYRAIALQLPRFDGMVFHASVLACDGRAYAFAAPSGTGKSTHTRLWLKVFGDRAAVVNGDKPIFRRINGEWRAFGTPWQGKEKWGANTSAPLHALCFLTRAAQNSIKPISDEEAVMHLFHQVLIPKDAEMADRFLALLDDMICKTSVHLLGCNMEEEAAVVAFEGMQKEKKYDSQ
jgi:hypothetical protein